MKKITKLGALFGFLFLTQFAFSQAGSTFTNPLIVSSLPNVATGESTCGFGDNYSTSDIACTGNYLNGDEKIYSFTPSANIVDFNVELTNISDSYSGMYITDDSTSTGNCVGSVGSSGTSTRGIYGVSLVSGTTYYIIVSTWATPQCITSYDINMYSVSCPAPSALGVSSVTTTSLDLGWTESGSATAWEIEWDTAGFTQGSGTTVAATANPHSLTGLTANTSYQFYVRSGCGAADSSFWSGPYTFNTACNTFSVPFNEGFNSNSSSINCWSIVDNNTDGDTWSLNTSSSYAQEGNQSAQAYTDFNSGANDDYLISPQITLTATNRLKFWSRARSASEPNDYKVLISTTTNALASFTDTLLVDTVNSTTYAEHIVDLAAYTGNVYIAFYIPIGGLDGYYLHIDNFTVEVTPNCLAPSAGVVTNLTSTSADLGWTENGSATTWDIEWDTAGFTAAGTPTITGSTTNPHSLTGLTANTSYEYYVRADCGGTTSAWAGPFSFYTGYCTPSPSSVDNNGITNVSMDTLNNTTGVEAGNYGDYSAKIANAGQQSNLAIDITLQTGYSYNVFAFVDWNNDLDFDDANEHIYLGESTSSNPDTLHAILPIPYNASLGNHRLRIGSADNGLGSTVPSNACYTGSYGSFEDYTLNVTAGPSCLAPANLAVSTVTNSSAQVSFVELGSATNWEIEWDTMAFTQGSGTVVSTTSLSNSISGLSSATAYEFYVRSVCGSGDSSVWVGPMSFVTLLDTITTFPYLNGFENGMDSYLGLADSANSNASLSPLAANGTGTGTGVLLTGSSSTGWSGGSTTATETQAFVNNSTHVSSIFMTVNATGQTNLNLEFDVKQTYSYGPKYSWGRVLINGVMVGNSVNPTTAGADAFETVNIDLSSYSGTTFTIEIQHSGKYSKANGFGGNGDEAFIDNVKIFDPMTATVAGTNLTCNNSADGTATITVANGYPAYTYLWSNGATTATASSLAAGDYYVTVTDNYGLMIYDTVTLTQPAALAMDLGNDTTLCMGATMTLDAGTFSSYTWDDASTTQTRSVATTVAGLTNYWVEVSDGTCTTSDTIAVTVAADPVVDLGNDTSVCDAVTLTLDAGTFASYAWDDASTTQTRMTVSTLGAVDYSVEVTDANGCTGNDTISVTGLADPIVNLGNDTSVCDAVSLTLDAGTFASYAWDDASTTQTRMTVSTLGAVDYSVEVTDANGCTGNDTISVTGFAVPMVNLGNDTSVCDAVTLTLDAGTFASYVWDDATTMQTRMTVSTLGAVDYSVEVTDANGCTGNDTISVTGTPAVVVDLGADTALCFEESLTLDAGSFASYLWNDASVMQTLMVSGSTLGATTYSVDVTDAAGCTGNDAIVVTGLPEVMVDLGADTNIWDPSATTFTLDAGAGFASYLWSDGTTTTQTYDVTPAADSAISVVVADANGCMGSDTVIVDFVLSVNSLETSSIKMYPNPAVEQVTIELTNFVNITEVNVSFISITGELVKSQKVNVNGSSLTKSFDVSTLATGTYFVQFEANGEVITRQFIIK
tara:strand:+ start:203331 stop:207902 length:4572 start_codon:yes stop_codon:yes gene_type:complete